MLINIRGTSGSGKTHTVRGIMAKGLIYKLGDDYDRPMGYQIVIETLDKPVFLLGSYENTCGGCDTIKTQDEICDLARMFAPKGHVLMEGLLMSHTFSRYAELDRELDAQGIHCIWAFLDTPLEVCLERVAARREERRLAKANPPEFKPLDPKNTSDKWHSNRATYKKFVEGRESDWKRIKGYTRAKLDARWVDHTQATEQIFQWLSQ